MARILGFDIRRSAPRVAVAGSVFQERSALASIHASSPHLVLPRPTAYPVVKAEAAGFSAQLPTSAPSRGSDLGQRSMPSDPLSEWYLNLPDKLQPSQVSAILRGALAGNIWQATQLEQKMADSWPMYAKCSYELRSAVAQAKYVTHPYSAPGQKPTQRALDKADLVRRNLESMKPDRFSDEDGARGMIFDVTGMVVNGVSICELIYDLNARDASGGREIQVRASAWVHPRHYVFDPEGRIGVAATEPDSYLAFPTQWRGDSRVDLRPEKYLVAKFKSKSGSCLGAGFMRKLAWYWTAVMYPREFLFLFGQKYGSPFMSIPYELGMQQTEIDKLEGLAGRAAAQGWMVHPKSAAVVIEDAQKAGGDNPQVVLMRMADEACQMLMLGQTLTSAAPVNGGTRAQGQVHENVRQERIEGICKAVAEDVLTAQFAESLIKLNYGETTERPTIKADLSRPMDASEQATYLKTVGDSKVPVLAEEVYEKAGMTVPTPGDQILAAGKLGKCGDTETDIDPNPLSPDDMMMEQGFQDGPPVGASVPIRRKKGDLVRAALAKATGDDLSEVEELLSAAEKAPHQNGEAKALREKLETISRRKNL